MREFQDKLSKSRKKILENITKRILEKTLEKKSKSWGKSIPSMDSLTKFRRNSKEKFKEKQETLEENPGRNLGRKTAKLQVHRGRLTEAPQRKKYPKTNSCSISLRIFWKDLKRISGEKFLQKFAENF